MIPTTIIIVIIVCTLYTRAKNTIILLITKKRNKNAIGTPVYQKERIKESHGVDR